MPGALKDCSKNDQGRVPVASSLGFVVVPWAKTAKPRSRLLRKGRRAIAIRNPATDAGEPVSWYRSSRRISLSADSSEDGGPRAAFAMIGKNKHASMRNG